MATNDWQSETAIDYVSADAPNVRVFEGPTWRSLVMRRVLQATVRPVLQTWGALPHLPWPYWVVDSAGSVLPPIRGTEYRRVRLPNCRAEWLRAPGVDDERVLLYLHGGAFVCCGLNTHRRLTSMISAACDAPALSVSYRMLPGTPISASIEDCLDGYRWLLNKGYRPDQIAFAGDSAGGFLVLMTALLARERGLPYPAAIVCESPFIDTDPCRKLEWLGDMLDPLFPANALISLTEMMTDVEAEKGHLDDGRLRSPLDADLSGLPPVLVQAGAEELLVVDAELIAAAIADAGAECTLELYEGQFHVFQAAADLVPEAADAIARIGEFVRSRVPVRAAL